MVEHSKSAPLETNTPIAYATSVDEYPAHAAASSPQEWTYPAHAPASSTQEWACPQCTLLNPVTAEFCGACMLQKPIMAHPEPGIFVQHEEEPDTQVQNQMKNTNTFIPTPDREVISESHVRDAPVSYTEYVEEYPLRKKRRRRRRRRFRMVIGGIGGLTLGAIVFAGPPGIIIGAVAGAAGARYISKRRERRKDARIAAGSP
jgi:hypothetical protein